MSLGWFKFPFGYWFQNWLWLYVRNYFRSIFGLIDFYHELNYWLDKIIVAEQFWINLLYFLFFVEEALQAYPPTHIRPRRAWHLAKASLRCRRRSLKRQKERAVDSSPSRVSTSGGTSSANTGNTSNKNGSATNSSSTSSTVSSSTPPPPPPSQTQLLKFES